MAQKFTVPITVKQLASAGSDAVTVYVDADTFARLKVEAGGRLTWGSGASAGDVNLYRASADVLQTDDTFKTPILYVDNIEIDTTGATTDQVLKFDGTKFVPGTGGSGGGASLTISDTPPTVGVIAGDLWYESDTGKTFVYYDSYWVEIVGSTGAQGPTGATGPTIPVAMRGSTLSLPGVILSAELIGQSLAAQTVLYFPIVVPTAITLSEISANVTTQSSTAGCKSRIAIYNSDASWIPTTLVLDCGEIACDSTGVKTLSMTQSLSAGRYFIRLHGDNSASRPSFYCYRGSPITGTLLGSTNQFVSAISKTGQTYAAAEATVASGNLPSNGSTSTSPFVYFVRSVWS